MHVLVGFLFLFLCDFAIALIRRFVFTWNCQEPSFSFSFWLSLSSSSNKLSSLPIPSRFWPASLQVMFGTEWLLGISMDSVSLSACSLSYFLNGLSLTGDGLSRVVWAPLSSSSFWGFSLFNYFLSFFLSFFFCCLESPVVSTSWSRLAFLSSGWKSLISWWIFNVLTFLFIVEI